MKVVALVGGSGTGKSTIAAHLVKRRGARLIDADRIAHDLLAGDANVVRGIRERFGDDVFTRGAVDRKKLARLVFGRPASLADLNAIVHPAVLDVCRGKLEEFRADGVRFVVVDAALLLEVDVPFRIDFIIALRASRGEREKRLVARGDRTPGEIAARLDRQSHLERSFGRADCVVDTAKPISSVLAEVDRVIDALLSESADGERGR